MSTQCVSAQRLMCVHTAIVYVQCTFMSVCTQALYGHARGEKDPVPLHLCLGCRLGLQSGADC